MKSLRMKLFTGISMFVVALALLIVGVWAIGETQTITMSGSVNFEIADKSLYVKDVRMQEDINSAPYSLKDQGRFKPGFINGNFDMDLGNFTNSYGSFALYFDIINTMDETTNETFAYTVEQPTAPSGTTVDVSILGSDGLALEQIPQGTVKPSEISDSTLVTATIKLTIASTSSSTVDLSGITITINQFIPEVYDYFTFEVNDDGKTVTLTDYSKNLSDSTDVVIPATVDLVDGVWQDGNTYTITAITDGSYTSGVFSDSGITSVTFPSSLTSIGSNAFYGCSGLTSVDLSGCTSLTSIGEYAFSGCSGLTGELNLSNCTSLTSIGDFAFYGCSGLTGELNLGGCTRLTSIGQSAFSGCDGLTGELNLGGCTSLTSIGSYAFIFCSRLTSITLPSSLTSIGESAFYNCSGLTGTVTIPASVTEIGENPFVECSNLEGIVVEEGNSEYYVKGNCLIENSTKTLITGFNNSTIPSDIKIIGGDAFDGCSGLTSISLPSSLTSIGERAFSSCSGLTGELNLGGCTSLTSIGDYAFQFCSGLTSVDLSGCTSLTSIGSDAFLGCDGLTSVDLSGCTSLTSIGSDAFRQCYGLTSVDLSGCTSLTSIGSDAFYGCYELTGELNLGGCTSLTSIGSYAFYGCYGLTSVDLSGCTSLTSIGISAFDGCSALESVVFPEGSTGWYVTRSSTATSGDSVTVTDSSVNANKLTGQYCEYYWKRG